MWERAVRKRPAEDSGPYLIGIRRGLIVIIEIVGESAVGVVIVFGLVFVGIFAHHGADAADGFLVAGWPQSARGRKHECRCIRTGSRDSSG